MNIIRRFEKKVIASYNYGDPSYIHIITYGFSRDNSYTLETLLSLKNKSPNYSLPVFYDNKTTLNQILSEIKDRWPEDLI